MEEFCNGFGQTIGILAISDAVFRYLAGNGNMPIIPVPGKV